MPFVDQHSLGIIVQEVMRRYLRKRHWISRKTGWRSWQCRYWWRVVPVSRKQALFVDLCIERSVGFGLNDLEMLTPAPGTLTLGRTNTLQGASHPVLFPACLFLIFNP